VLSCICIVRALQPHIRSGVGIGIRIAYFSADFHEHPIAYLAGGMFEHHDRSRFETIAISFGPAADSSMRRRLMRSFDRFIDVRAQSDQAIIELVGSLQVDIAVDLKGFTQDARIGIFAKHPAPIQVNYLGYAGTLGQTCWDYIIADRFVIPEGVRHNYAEHVVYLPETFMVTDQARNISERTPSRQDEGLPESGRVFCCFNNSFKITPDVFGVWMRLLQKIDGSVLWLSSTSTSGANNLRLEAQARGVSPDRLIFAPKTRLIEDHLSRQRLADLFLDTPYYNAHAMAADALWAGVPVLTCSGLTFSSRVAGSLLKAVGLPELITHSIADYESLALELGRDPGLLASIRQKLACHRETYPLFNTARYTRHMEAAYAKMWERLQRGERPESFEISPLEHSRKITS
jgi:protein O-GlcNAc transferase